MKNNLRRIFAVLSAAGLAAAMAASVSAESFTDTIVDKKVYVNHNYLNITVDSGDLNTDGLGFALKKDGNTIAAWESGADDFWLVSTKLGSNKLVDITGYTAETDWGISDWEGLVDPIETDIHKKWTLYKGEPGKGKSVSPVDGKYYAGLDDSYYQIVPDRSLLDVADTMELPAGKVGVYIDEGYKNFVGDKLAVGLIPTEKDDVVPDLNCELIGKDNKVVFADYANEGKTGLNLFNADIGDYALVNYSQGGGSSYGPATADITVESTDTGYTKYKFNLADAFRGEQDYLTSTLTFGENNTFTLLDKETGETINGSTTDVTHTDDGDVMFNITFHSGAVICAPTPDDEGNIEVWVKDGVQGWILSSCWIDIVIGRSSRRYVTCVDVPNRVDVFDTSIEYPTEGYTLYNLPSGEYKVELSSDAYELENDTIVVEDTTDLQKAVLKLKAAAASSSEPESSSEASSSESSSEASSSENSSEASSSENSSETSSSESSSEASSSSSSSAASSSSSAASSSGAAASSKAAASSTASANSNPATGAAGTGIVALGAAAAAIMASKKKNK